MLRSRSSEAEEAGAGIYQSSSLHSLAAVTHHQGPAGRPGQEAFHSRWKVIISSCTERQSPLHPVLVFCEGGV